MINLSKFVFNDNGKFYFDPENYSNEQEDELNLSFEDGDMIKWTWEGKKMYGTLRSENRNLNLFLIEKVGCLK
jgi:hypothetical protein